MATIKVTIEGPSGSGKSIVAKLLMEVLSKLNIKVSYLDAETTMEEKATPVTGVQKKWMARTSHVIIKERHNVGGEE